MTIKRRSMVCVVLLLVMIATMCIPVMAANKQVITIPANQAWMCAGTDDRLGAFSYAQARNHSVYPKSGNDFFSKIQCKITNKYGNLLCVNNYYTLDEGDSKFTQMDIREGMLTEKTVYFYFRGNSQKSAEAVVSYNAP